jgi:amidase
MTATDKSQESFDGIIDKLDIKSARDNVDVDRDLPLALAGLTFSVKDSIAVAGHVAGFGNPDWKRTHEPAVTHADAIESVLEAGAHLVATACCDEITFSLDGINRHFGTPLNKQYPNRIPGGSSSGSASMVAASLVDFALGTDTAGSVRVPASFCGLWALRPTHGAISTNGVLPLGPSFDTVGIFAKEAEMLGRVASVLLKQEPKESRFKKLIVPDLCWQLLSPELAPYMVSAKNKLAKLLGIEQEEDLTILGPEYPEEMVHNFNLMRSYEAWQCHGRWLEETNPLMDPAIEARIRNCKDTSKAQADRAALIQIEMKELIADVFDGSTLICLPTTWSLPPYRGTDATNLLLHRSKNMQLCALSSFLGLPQISIPVSVGHGKLGLSLIAGAGQDSRLMCKSVLTIGHI